MAPYRFPDEEAVPAGIFGGTGCVGRCARIAAGSVVLKSVPNNVTVAGVPARVVGEAGCSEPSRTMDQMLNGESF